MDEQTNDHHAYQHIQQGKEDFRQSRAALRFAKECMAIDMRKGIEGKVTGECQRQRQFRSVNRHTDGDSREHVRCG